MHVRILAIGSRGDVQAHLALGVGLQAAGYDVALVTTADFAAFVQQYGLDVLTSSVNLRAFMTDPDRRQQRWAIFRQFLDDTPRLLAGADLAIYSPAAAWGAPIVTKQMGIPSVLSMLQVYLHPTRDFPTLGFPALPLGGTYNYLTYGLFEKMLGLALKSRINRWRREALDLPRLSGGLLTALRQQKVPTLYAFSSLVVPRPPEWGPHIHLTGYWQLDQATHWQPPAALVDFLAAGPAPVYVGFGSMTSDNPQAMAALVLDALRQAGARAILQAGWAGLQPSDLPDDVFMVEDCPHAWLFPRMAVVVHHGGAGTTAAGLRAGVPTIIIPKGGDQPFWGRRVAALGVGPQPLSRRNLTADRLGEVLRAVMDDATMHTKAHALRTQLQAEDGVGAAVQVIHAMYPV